MEKERADAEQIRTVEKMQEVIAGCPDREMTPADLGRAVGYSPWHARRLFLKYVGISPAEYRRKLQLRRAALTLRDSKARVIDVAMEAGFDSVDGFRRAFLREFGCSPRDFAKYGLPIPLYTPWGISSFYLRRSITVMETHPIFLQVVAKPARKVILKRGIKADEYWSYCQEVGCDVWGILTSIKSLEGEPVCLWLPQSLVKPGTSIYVQGAEVPTDYDGPIPEGFDVITLPASEYLLFQGLPFAEEDFESAIMTVWEAEKKYDPTQIGYEWDEKNPRYQLEPRGERGYRELLPIRKK